MRNSITFGLATVENAIRDFPGGPAVETLPSNARGIGLIPSHGAKSPRLTPKKLKHRKEEVLSKIQ